MEATFVKNLAGWRGDARLYRLSAPDTYRDLEFDHVVVSGVYAYSGPETYIFPCDKDGEALSYGELEGSFRGDIDHERAITEFCRREAS